MVSNNIQKRKSGILIHPTSFYSPYICGDLGDCAREILDWLKKSGQSILQVLPLGPTGFGDSPYQSFSAFAGTPYIISFDILIKKGYLNKSDLKDYPAAPQQRVDYYLLYKNNFNILKKAFIKFMKKSNKDDYHHFCNMESYWLDDYSLFMSIKNKNDGASWNKWDESIKKRNNLDAIKESLKESIDFYKFIQWEFFNQWTDLKDYAHEIGISIIGDAPIFVSYDSSDVWSNQHLFYLNEEGLPEVVAGVPPDYFSETGQLWGNPIYRWDKMIENDFNWWKKRIKNILKLVDCIRIDHFRGFEAYWEIPFGEKTAINGKWVKAPGLELFNSFKKEFGNKLPEIIIAEDLGIITDEVKLLRDRFKLPGMRIFEFANFPNKNVSENKEHIDNFTEDAYLPENYIENCIAYPGTHDNDTLSGWFDSLSKEKQNDILNYLKIKSKNKLNFAVIESLMKSNADRVVYLIQDVLQLNSENRMNTPGTCGIQNWSWRLTKNMLTDELAEKLYNLTKKTGRI